jgi:hypothetical protein
MKKIADISAAYTQKEAEVFLALVDILKDIIGEDVVEIIGIKRENNFISDLMFESIQLVAFAERVNELYGHKANLSAWLTGKPFRQWLEITVGDISEFIASELGK